MISAFVHRKPWPTVVVTVIGGPMVGMLYLGKGKKALAYLVGIVVSMVFLYLIGHFQFIELNSDFLSDAYPLGFLHLTILIIGVPHCHLISKKMNGKRPMIWFSGWKFLFLILFLPFFIRSLLWEPFSIPSGSMHPNLLVGDQLFVSKYSYGFSKYSFILFETPFFSGRIFYAPPERGDIAVFKSPTKPDVDLIERLIGMPGDRLQVKKGILHINGQAIEREAVGDYKIEGSKKTYKRYSETLPNGRQYHILEEFDTGPMDNTQVFVVPAGHFFGMGDNRDNSSDSRYLDNVGYIPMENLVGKLSLIYWNTRVKRLRFLE